MRNDSTLCLKYALLLAGVALVTTSFMSSSQEETTKLNGNRTEDIRKLPGKETAGDFRGVAKKAIPAVVSIKVQTKKKSTPFESDSGGNLNDYFGSSDIWKFFGISQQSDSKPQPFVGQASGVIVSQDGYILTNSHVVHGMNSIAIQLTDGREFSAKLLGEDPNSDLALIKINAKDLPYLTLGNSDDLEVGQWVAAIGNPFGLQATLTVGVVSATSRNNLDIVRYEDFIQTDAAINRGNSGGPLVTLDGKVAGINTAIATTTNSGYLGIGFAIPSNMAQHVMDDILADGKVSRGFLGVSLQSIDYTLAKAFGLKKVEGALVANVARNSAAKKAGLQTEDVILAYNDHPVESAATLRNTVYMLKPGTKITLTVLRNDQIMNIPVTVGAYSDSSIQETVANNTQFGIEVGMLTTEIAKKMGYTQDEGVVITKVAPNSIAEMAGLKAGALILGVNRQKVSTVEEYKQAVANTAKDTPLLLQIKQGDNYLFISLQQS